MMELVAEKKHNFLRRAAHIIVKVVLAQGVVLFVIMMSESC